VLVDVAVVRRVPVPPVDVVDMVVVRDGLVTAAVAVLVVGVVLGLGVTRAGALVVVALVLGVRVPVVQVVGVVVVPDGGVAAAAAVLVVVLLVGAVVGDGHAGSS
jgi:hypothetical protein